jgi:hypothetical protein
VATATWGRQTEASIQWGDNQFRFLEVPEENAYFYFFLKKIWPPPEICRPRRPPNGKTASVLASAIFRTEVRRFDRISKGKYFSLYSLCSWRKMFMPFGR